MKYFLKSVFAVLVTGLAVVSANVYSQELGNYHELTYDAFTAMTDSEKRIYKLAPGKENGHDVYFCADHAGIPGKLIDGICYVPWNGKEYKNYNFHLLLDDPALQFEWAWPSVSTAEWTELFYFPVVPGGRDGNYYLYHCVVDQWPLSRSQFVGAYYPHRRECIIPWRGKSYSHASLRSDVDLLVRRR